VGDAGGARDAAVVGDVLEGIAEARLESAYIFDAPGIVDREAGLGGYLEHRLGHDFQGYRDALAYAILLLESWEEKHGVRAATLNSFSS